MSLESLLDSIASTPLSPDVTLLRQLVAAIRPEKANQTHVATNRLNALIFLLKSHPHYATALGNYVSGLVSSRQSVHLFTDTGITLSNDFWNAAWDRLMHKFLPPLVNDRYLRDVFGTVFNKADDYIWIQGIDDAVWFDLIQTTGIHPDAPELGSEGFLDELLSSLQVLSYRITAIGLEAELVRNFPAIERHESPFLHQNDEINAYVHEFRLWRAGHSVAHRDSRHVDVLLTQCEDIIKTIKRTSSSNGVSVSLTRLLLRASESITRLRHLLELIEAPDREKAMQTGVRLFKELVCADNRKFSMRELMRSNTRLLTLQVSEHAGRSGEHYVANNRSERLSMLYSASGAGFIIAFMSLTKLLFGKLLLAPFGFAFFYSLNYSLGFMLVHILHFTIATKQPAMTAALIARTLDRSGHKLDELTGLAVQVIRTQFIAIAGNIVAAVPTAFVISLLWNASTGQHIVSADKARLLIHDINPFTSLSVFHAAIAGVCLFLSGLISGYFDNNASYNKIAERLLQIPAMTRLFGAERWQRITTYIGNNLGALAGNFYFGIMLGSIGQIGLFLGLPIDIRHVTFASANFMIALAGLDFVLPWQDWVDSILGIFLIGVANLAVSFSLALYVAMRSRDVSFRKSGELVILLWRRLLKRGGKFFLRNDRSD